ncbi:MAG: outer membrane beta-barrel protein [Bacteroidota bacterium]
MKKFSLLVFALLSLTIASAQDSKFSATLGYPIAFGDNFLADYTGIIDLGLQYRFIEAGLINVGLSMNGGYYSENTELGLVTVEDRVLLIQPKAYAELNGEVLGKFRPFLGLGYTIVSSSVRFEGAQSEPDRNDSEGGLNVNLGMAYDISERLFAHVQYDYLNISRDNPNQDIDFFTNASILKLGIGFRF